MSTIKRFFRDESGATAIEYGLIAAGISVAIITWCGTVGTSLMGTFQRSRISSVSRLWRPHVHRHDLRVLRPPKSDFGGRCLSGPR